MPTPVPTHTPDGREMTPVDRCNWIIAELVLEIAPRFGLEPVLDASQLALRGPPPTTADSMRHRARRTHQILRAAGLLSRDHRRWSHRHTEARIALAAMHQGWSVGHVSGAVHVAGQWRSRLGRDTALAMIVHSGAASRLQLTCGSCSEVAARCLCRAAADGTGWHRACAECRGLVGRTGEGGCTCVACSSCSARVPAARACQRCSRYGAGQCNTCCTTQPPIMRNYRHTPAESWHGEATKMVPRYVGLEIEVAGWQRNSAPRCDLNEVVARLGGDIKPDGSLPHTGREVAMHPARGRALAAMARDVCGSLARLGAVVDRSCGGHIHVDARDLDRAARERLLVVWKAIEPAMMELVPSHRHDNRYAMRIGGAIKVDREARRVVNDYGGNRYSALNMDTPHRTVEFRFWDSTIDAATLAMRGAICARVVDFAHRSTWEECVALLDIKHRNALGRCLSPRQRAWVRSHRSDPVRSPRRTGVAAGMSARHIHVEDEPSFDEANDF